MFQYAAFRAQPATRGEWAYMALPAKQLAILRFIDDRIILASAVLAHPVAPGSGALAALAAKRLTFCVFCGIHWPAPC